MALTPKQQRFVDEYLIDLNGTQAAVEGGYSAKTAQEQPRCRLTRISTQRPVQEALSNA